MVKFTDVEAAHQQKETNKWTGSTNEGFIPPEALRIFSVGPEKLIPVAPTHPTTPTAPDFRN